MADEQTTQTSTPAAETKDAAPATEAPLLGGAKPTEGEQKTDAAPDAKPPEEPKYEWTDLPEGYDASDLTKFAKENKLAPDVARKLVDREIAAVERFREGLERRFANLNGRVWVEQLKADKEIGGKNWDATVAAVKLANDKLPESIKKEIDDNKLGNSPVLVKILNTFGKMLKEDKFERGNAATSQPASFAKRMGWE